MGVINRIVSWVFGIWFLIGAANLIFGDGWTGHLGGAAALVALAIVAFAWSRLTFWLCTPKEERAWSAIDSQAFKLHQAGKLAEAEPLYIQAREVAEASGRPVLVATARNNLAGLYMDQERWDEAEPLLRQALELRETNLGPDNEMTLASVERLSGLFALRERWHEAEELQQRALASYLRAGNQRAAAATYNAIAVACRHQGKYDESDSNYAEGQRVIDKAKLSDSPVAAQLLADWGYLRAEQGNFAEAETMYLKALKLGGPDATKLDNLADLYTKSGRQQEAADTSTKALLLVRAKMQSKFGRSDHGALIPLLDQHARRLEAAGRASDAAAALAESDAIRKLHPDEARKVDEIAQLER